MIPKSIRNKLNLNTIDSEVRKFRGGTGSQGSGGWGRGGGRRAGTG